MCLESDIFTAGFFWAFKAVKTAFFAVVFFVWSERPQKAYFNRDFLFWAGNGETYFYVVQVWRQSGIFLLLYRPLVWSSGNVYE